MRACRSARRWHRVGYRHDAAVCLLQTKAGFITGCGTARPMAVQA